MTLGLEGDGGELIGLSNADGTWQGVRGPHEKKRNYYFIDI